MFTDGPAQPCAQLGPLASTPTVPDGCNSPRLMELGPSAVSLVRRGNPHPLEGSVDSYAGNCRRRRDSLAIGTFRSVSGSGFVDGGLGRHRVPGKEAGVWPPEPFFCREVDPDSGLHDALERYHRDLAVVPAAVLVAVCAGDNLVHPGEEPIAFGTVRHGGGPGPVLFSPELQGQLGISNQVAVPLRMPRVAAHRPSDDQAITVLLDTYRGGMHLAGLGPSSGQKDQRHLVLVAATCLPVAGDDGLVRLADVGTWGSGVAHTSMMPDAPDRRIFSLGAGGFIWP